MRLRVITTGTTIDVEYSRQGESITCQPMIGALGTMAKRLGPKILSSPS